MPAPKGNTNHQQGDKKASSWLQVRVMTSDKANWVKCASVQGMKLSEWVKDVLNRNCD